jgi:hypothetical protein
MDVTGYYHVKQYKPDSEKQKLQNIMFILYVDCRLRRGDMYVKGGNIWRDVVGGVKEGSKYDQSTLYTCMKLSQQNPLLCVINVGY